MRQTVGCYRLILIAAVLATPGVIRAQDESGAGAAAPAVKEDAEAPMAEASEEEVPEEGVSEEEESLPKVEDVPLPTYEELLSGPRRDWIILLNDRLIVVEPIYPRPNALQRIQAERDEILRDNRRRFSEAGRVRLAELNDINIFLPDDDSSTEYTIRRTEIREILHHEDLMLRRASELVKAGETRKAFELMLVVARRDPTWPGLSELQTQLTVADADRFLTEGDAERAFSLIVSLYEQTPVPGEASPLLGRAAEQLLELSIAAQDYRQARFSLERVRGVDAEHPSIGRGRERLISLARTLQAEAEAAAKEGDGALATTKIEQAARAWPRLPGLRPVHARLTEGYQRLVVGVSGLSSAERLAVPTSADERVARLVRGDLFEIEGFDALPIYRSVYFERWEPTDLGRQAKFQLRPSLPAAIARPPLTASDMVAVLNDRFREDSRDYDARFADSVKSLSALAPFTFEVGFRRIPLQTEATLSRSSSGSSNGNSNADDAFVRFREIERTDDRVVYRRRESQQQVSSQLMEVVERSFPSYEKAVQALDRGEVRMLADVPVWDVPRLRDDPRYMITKLAVPRTHLLQFHAESILSTNAELRRALVASIDPTALLQTVIGSGNDEAGRLVTAPFPSTHLGYDPLVAPRRLDLALALALSLAAEKGLGESLPELTFAVPADSPGREVAEAIAGNWKRIGLAIRVVTLDELDPSEHWDIAYRELAILDPVKELGPLITLDSAVEISSLEDLPEWLRQRLLDLERASDDATAQEILIDLHRLLYADVRIAPLFEVDRYVVSRGAIRGLPQNPVAVYQNAERWGLPHDYPEETP